jgi:hypothetical protein
LKGWGTHNVLVYQGCATRPNSLLWRIHILHNPIIHLRRNKFSR